MGQAFYVTTPIYYVNDKPHIGHTYTTVMADVAARYHRLRGDEVWFLTGTDEHGQKVLRKAQERGLSPREHADELHQRFKDVWARLDISYDDFIRTTETRHSAVVQQVLQTLYERGDIYRASYAGWYSTAAERFWTEKDLIDGKCPESGLPVEWLEESNYFFKMSHYADQLRRWIEERPDWVRPEYRRNEVLGALRKDIGDLCISRPVSRMSWGIPLPFDADYVTYVWFDALLNYVSALGYGSSDGKFQKFWPANLQLIGKDILTTHTLYWGTMLFAMGLEPADCIFAHGWWTVEGQKMSKSLGNVVDPHLLCDAYGPEPVRYVLMSEKAPGPDGDFSHRGFQLRYNAELANDIGNLAHRALNMTQRWLDSVVPPLDPDTEADLALAQLTRDAIATYAAQMDRVEMHEVVAQIVAIAGAGNKYVDSQAPWALNKAGDRARLGGVLRRVLELCRVVGVLLAPFCPSHARELLGRLGAGEPAWTDQLAQLNQLTEGATISVGEPLFARMLELPPTIIAALAAIEPPAAPQKTKESRVSQPPNAPAKPVEAAKPAEAAPPAEAAKPAEVPLIEYDDFAKVQLRAGRVLSAERHPNADRLIVMKVDVGEPEPRTIVAGIASRYAPEELVGQQVVAVVNLKPVKLRGVVSQGMLLAAGGGNVQAMVTTTQSVDPGTIIR